MLHALHPPHYRARGWIRLLPRSFVLVWLTVLLFSNAFHTAALAEEPKVNSTSVKVAINRAVEWIKSQRNATGVWDSGEPGGANWAGDTALASLALLYANEDARQDDMSRTLDWLAAQPINSTYVYGLRAHVFSITQNDKFKKRIDSDLLWLLDAVNPATTQTPGSYNYMSWKQSGYSGYDNSNSQFGVLGVWMATEAGAKHERLTGFWKMVEDHWLRDQRPDGGWSYRNAGSEPSTGSMTAAGLTSLYVVLDRAHSRNAQRRAEPVTAAIDRALDWFGTNFKPENPNGSASWNYYYLYGVERAGRASGRKYFRDRDWFRVGAGWLLERQQPGGNWTDLHDTCFALMFLCHGQAPIFYNKLEKGDDWDRHLRDANNIARYGSRSLERLYNWQIVSLENAVEDLMESPVLYMNGSQSWQFDESERARIEQYVAHGGMILAVAPPGKSEFRNSIEKLAKDLWPKLRMRPLRNTHPLLSGAVQHPINPPPDCFEMRSETRTYLLLVADDMPANWNQQKLKEGELDFQFGVNVHLYATDKTSLESRLDTPEIALEPKEPKRTIKLGRMKYDGNWDIEAHGWERLETYLNNVSSTKLTITSGVRCTEAAANEFPVLHVTGVGSFSLNSEEVTGLRRYLTGGGTLIADAAMGSIEFADSFEAVMRDVLKVEPVRVPESSPILTGVGIDGAGKLSTVEYRRATRAEGRGRDVPPLRMYLLGDRPAVIFSPLDVSVGMLGTHVYDCRGYDGNGPLEVMRNMVLFAGLARPEKARLIGDKR